MANTTGEKQIHLLKNAFAHALGLLTVLESISFSDDSAIFESDKTWQTLYGEDRKPPSNTQVKQYIEAVREDIVKIGGQTGAWHDQKDIPALSQGLILASLDRAEGIKKAKEEGVLISQLQTTIWNMADKVLQMRRDSGESGTILSSILGSNNTLAKERAELVSSLVKDADNVRGVLGKLSCLDEEQSGN